jgi:two-component system sensor kinase FixL
MEADRTFEDLKRGGAKTANTSGVLDNRLFHRHFENLPGPAFIWQRMGSDFQLIAYNHAAAANPVGPGIAPLIGNRASRVMVDNPTFVLDLAQCEETASVVMREVDFFYPSTGALRRVVTTFVPVVAGTVVVHTEDITERRRAERALAESERKYRTIVDTTSEGVWMVDAGGETTFVNRQMAAMLGYTPAEMMGRSMFDFMDETARALAEQRQIDRRKGLTEQFDARLQRKDGSEIWTSISATPLKDEAGNFVGSFGMVSDISARKHAEQALRESETRIRALLDSNPDVIFRMDKEGNFLDLHAAKSSGFPFDRDEILGHNIAEFYGEEAQRTHRQYARDALQTGKRQIAEYKVPIGGCDIYLESRFVRSGENEVVVNVRDITERVTLERELTVIGERERNRIGRDIHDGLAQNLAGAKMLLEHLTKKLEEDGSPYAHEAGRGVTLLNRTIKEARELARGLSPVPEGGSLFGALEELAKNSETVFGIHCTVGFSGTVGQVDEAVKAQLYRIAQEAITNAVKHGKATQVALCCDASNERLELSVSDDGCGVPDDPTGEGLGLRIMRHRARSVGGRITIARRAGGGTRVACTCPLIGLIAAR